MFDWYYNPAQSKFYFNKIQLAESDDIKSITPISKDSLIVNDGERLIGYDLKNGKQFFTTMAEREISTVDASKQNNKIAYSSFNDLIIQDLMTHEKKVIKSAHSDKITSIAFCPTKNLIATASWDATLKLWNSETGELIATIIAIGKDDHI
ncbi:MAG TPA: hypothetical protein DGG95_02010, partial [Cytophagales bacterium]|nr:hypothetical protein [Cytophagales bacterium]